MLSQIPGTFMWFGTGDPHTPEHMREWNHSPLARFNDSVLGDQAAALAAVAFERLAAEDAHPSPATKAMREPVRGTGSGQQPPSSAAQ